MKPVDYLILLVIAILVFLSARSLYRNRKKGNGCSCGCDHCAMACTDRAIRNFRNKA